MKIEGGSARFGLGHDVRLGPSTGAIVRAARARGIPVRRLNTESLVVLGQGSKQRRICTAETDRTSAIAESIAQDKELTRSLLRAVGVAVPEGRVVRCPGDAWPADRATFGAYWDHMITTIRVSDEAREIAAALMRPKNIPLAMRPARPLNRLVTVGLLPAPIRTRFGYPWSPQQQRPWPD